MNQTALPSTYIALVGAGTVGLAILRDHLAHDCPVALFDVQEATLQNAAKMVAQRWPAVQIAACTHQLDGAHGLMFVPDGGSQPEQCSLLIESVSENLALKQSLFPRWRAALGPDVLLASNTSNLLIANVFAGLPSDPNCLGLHFFMPVTERPLVECIVTECTSAAAIDTIRQLALRLGKRVLFPADSPGFVVNRLLAPYLNQALTLLQWGVHEQQIEQAAIEFGMPLSPFRLIDTIGIRTAFDSGRVFWQAFPDRIEPSAILPGLIRAGRKSSQSVRFYDNDADANGDITSALTFGDQAADVVQTYRITTDSSAAGTHPLPVSWNAQVLTMNLALVMWIEALLLLRDKVVPGRRQVELAMSHGLGYRQPSGLFGLVDSFDWPAVKQHLADQADRFKSLRLPAELKQIVTTSSSASEATARWLG